MISLYAILGMAMLTGIMAIMEMGLSLTGRSLLPLPQNQYLTSTSVKLMDRHLLGLLADTKNESELLIPRDLSGQRLCDSLKDAYNNYPLNSLPNPWIEDSVLMEEYANDPQSFWRLSCVLNDSSSRHHVLINPDLQTGSYELFSCVLPVKKTRCKFEEG